MAFEFIKSKLLKLSSTNSNKSDDFNVFNSNSDTSSLSNRSIKAELEEEIDFTKVYSHLYDIPLFKRILSKVRKNSGNETLTKIHKVLDEINQGGFYSLDGSKLQSFMFNGLPDELPVLRTLVWKLALKYPNVPIIHTPKWQEEIDQKRSEYFSLVNKHYYYINKLKKRYKEEEISEMLEQEERDKLEQITQYLENSNPSSNSKVKQLNSPIDIKHKAIDSTNSINGFDHPLNNSDDSEWTMYFKDIELLDEIQKDVRRTRAQMSFFFMPADSSLEISNEEIALKADYTIEYTKLSKSKINKDFESHGDVLTRILFVFAKEYPSIRYVQGMNEVLAIIYYQFCLDNDCDNDQFLEFNEKDQTSNNISQSTCTNKNSQNNTENNNYSGLEVIISDNSNNHSKDKGTLNKPDKQDQDVNKANENKGNSPNKKVLKDYLKIEADSYNCFRILMDEIKDLFIREKDQSRSGIQTRIKGVNLLLREIDKEIYSKFADSGVEIQFFMFRWYTLLFTQEYEMPDVIRLWDSILSFVRLDCNRITDKFMFLNFLCLAAILMKKDLVMKSDFAGTMLAYQNMDFLEVSKHIQNAYKILNFYKEKYNK